MHESDPSVILFHKYLPTNYTLELSMHNNGYYRKTIRLGSPSTHGIKTTYAGDFEYTYVGGSIDCHTGKFCPLIGAFGM